MLPAITKLNDKEEKNFEGFLWVGGFLVSVFGGRGECFGIWGVGAD